MGEEKKKRCFIITPIGEPESDIRKKADGLIAAVIKPVVERYGYTVICPHEMSKSGSITQQVIEEILNDELVIANLTGLNANVMYELAIRHATRKPVITLSERSTKLPFDISTERTLFYEDNMFQVAILNQELEKAIKESANAKNEDNPIFRAKLELEVRTTLPNTKEGNALEFIINKIGELDTKLGYINNIQTYSKRNVAIQDLGSYAIIIENCLDNCGLNQAIEIVASDSVQDVLDKVYFAISNYVTPYQYMQSWVLRESNTGVYMIMYEVTSLVPASFIFKKDSHWQVIEWKKYNLSRSKNHKGYNNYRHST